MNEETEVEVVAVEGVEPSKTTQNQHIVFETTRKETGDENGSTKILI